ncbi:DUF4446 family protein [Clostridium sp. D2Q-11]|uniref:DUF4446 family protein n=1 Tax=Anaeromonas frigoriresistens TaxID=2683708 RepID=A0A942UYF4_9FIRM|nr:DUF4446 family protein [Anaeromonas frigoriresistens]MBS4539291.1 DUF4446 family protein [Anaeromonas frigoriresistens]
MDRVNEILNLYTNEIILGLIVFSLFLLLLFLIQEFRVSSIKKKYNKLLEDSKGTSLEEILFNHLDEMKNVKEEVKEVKNYASNIDNRLKTSIQRVGMIRYNAFDDMGSDLSFSVALLDDNNTGIVISNLFGRNESITYGKPVINGESDYKLSIEEIQAIDRAKRNSLYMEDKMRKAVK